MAITEVHLGCTREEQLRWLDELWTAAVHARGTGVDVRAVTPWAAFGAFDWNSLLTRDEGYYEPGVFDIRASSPRATVLSGWIKAIAAGEAFDHPVLDVPGWWHRLDRLCYPPVSRREQGVSSSVRTAKTIGKPSRAILITGATGTLGQAFARICEKRGLAYYLLSRRELDIANIDSVRSALDVYEPWAVINAAGYVRVDDAETEVDKCHRENVSGPVCLARECERRGLRLVTFSSDLVFDGRKQAAYVETDQVAPLNVYGASKVRAETEVLDLFPAALVIRTSAFFGPWDRYNFAHLALQCISNRRPFRAANDSTVSPTYVPDLVNATLDLLIDNEKGIWHLANAGALTWADFARLIAANGGYDVAHVEECAGKDLAIAATRPAFSALASERGNLMPPVEESVDRFLFDYKWKLNAGFKAARANS